MYEQYHFNVGQGPDFCPSERLPTALPRRSGVRLIAYYLPQYHSIKENDAWWGPGFTEWTNVTKALPRYVGHRQPRLPADLGFYDLGSKRTIERQARHARRAGVFGFCIHDYWFSGKKLLERPLQIILENPDIDIPFCLNWANENWTRRWDGHEHDVLMAQDYVADVAEQYMDSLLPALNDPRYIKIAGRPLIMVYRPDVIPGAAEFIQRCRDHLLRKGLPNPYLVMAQVHGQRDPRPTGMDAAAGFPPHGSGFGLHNRRKYLRLLDPEFVGFAADYEQMAARSLAEAHDGYRAFPGVCPGWDNEARKPGRGSGFFGATPKGYERWLAAACRQAEALEEPDERIVFINAWNEWGEGAVLEPDRHAGHAYLTATRRVAEGDYSAADAEARAAGLGVPQSLYNRGRNALNLAAQRLRLSHRWSA